MNYLFIRGFLWLREPQPPKRREPQPPYFENKRCLGYRTLLPEALEGNTTNGLLASQYNQICLYILVSLVFLFCLNLYLD